MGDSGKTVEVIEEMSKNSKKIQGYRSWRADSKNIGDLWSRSNFNIFGFEIKFFEDPKNCNILAILEEPRRKVGSEWPNPVWPNPTGADLTWRELT